MRLTGYTFLFIFVLFVSFAISDDFADDYYKDGNDILHSAVNAAIAEMLRLNTKDKNGFAQIFERVFGTDRSIPIPPLASCISQSYPENEGGILSYVLKNKVMVFGASSISRPPKIFNCTYSSINRKDRELYKCNGFEAEVGQSVMNLISKQYLGDESIQTYFAEVKWNYNATDNMYYHLEHNVYDAILSGMDINGKWTMTNGETVDRTTLFHFSCPYQTGGNAIVAGEKDLPFGVKIVNLQSLNRTDIYTCVDYGTSMAIYIEEQLTNGNIVYCGVNGTESSDCKQWTIDGTKCHVYIAPLLNALYDEKTNEELTMEYILEGGSEPIGIAMRYNSINFAITNTPCVFIIIMAIFIAIL